MTHRPITARIEAITHEAVRLRSGTHAAWFALKLLDAPGRRAVAQARVGDSVETGVEAWKLDELRWPDPRDRTTPDLFGAPR